MTNTTYKVRLQMTKPKMIIFDYGHTLMCEPRFDGLRGATAIMEYAIRNPRNYTPAQVAELNDEIY